ncbi:MAG: hypothetical protein LBH16_04585 [Treponema sp.]|jgi:hypothetical protein|nr:hypothetical protein [Treponema sp.]
MHVPEKYYDEVFEFRGKWDMPSRCGLRIIKKETTIVIVTELYQDNPGTSVTAAGKLLADQICREKNLIPEKIIYLECNPDTSSKLSFYDEEFFEVDFTKKDKPVYRQLNAKELKDLLGFPERL